MSRYRVVDVNFWNDAKVRLLSQLAKLVLLFIMTHPSMTMLGAMRATMQGLAAELDVEIEAFRKAFEEVLSIGVMRYDERAAFVWLPNFLKYNKPQSPNVVRAWPDAFDLLPECGLKYQLLQSLKAFAEGMSKGFTEAFEEVFAKAMANQEQEQEQERTISSNADASAADLTSLPDASAQSNYTAAVAKVWEYYLAKANRNAKTYAFTTARRKKGLSRLRECLAKTGGDIEKAVQLMSVAIDALCMSDWHMGRDPKTNGIAYREWDEHLFGSYETMEKWWKPMKPRQSRKSRLRKLSPAVAAELKQQISRIGSNGTIQGKRFERALLSAYPELRSK